MKLKHLFLCLILLTVNAVTANEPVPDLTLHIPMRDGYELPTDIYLPHADAKNLPCILLRTPAGKRVHPWQGFALFAKLGYVVAIQDTRSATDEEGKTFPYFSDGWGVHQDGYDTVEWLAKHPLTNGKIGTIGFSATGITQLLMAPSAPPSLQCQYIGLAAGDLHSHAIFPGGKLLKNQVEGWLRLHAKDMGVLNYVLHQPFHNDFWSNFDSIKVSHQVKVPAIIYGGWYDTFLKGTLDAFMARQNLGGEGAKGTQKLMIGPWTHYWPLSKQLGDFPVPEEGYAPGHDMTPQYWFEHYLKDNPNEAPQLPNITYYVMGTFDGSPSSGNVWRTADEWPVPARLTPFYLKEDHSLSESEGQSQNNSDLSYIYDPRNPIPTIGGKNLFLESGPKDQTPIENRSDIVLFTSEPLTEDLEVTGPISAKIYFASDRADTDVVVLLTDVYPDGRSILIADGVFRTGAINCINSEQVFKKDQPQLVEVDLWSTSIVFAKGHKIRISISSSNYPRYEKNLNIGYQENHTGKFAIAHNSIHMGRDYPSHLLLPVTRRGDVSIIQNKN